MNKASDYEPRWRDLFERQAATLEEAAHMLLCRQEDPKEILRSVVNQLKNGPSMMSSHPFALFAKLSRLQ